MSLGQRSRPRLHSISMSPLRGRLSGLLLSLLMVFGATALGAKTKRPSEAELEAALKTLVQLAASEEGSPKTQQMIGVSVLTLTAVLAGIDVASVRPQTALQSPKLDKKRKELVQKGIDVDQAIQPMLDEIRRFRCKSLQSTAKIKLSQLRTSEEILRMNKGTYTKNLKDLDVKLDSEFYRFTVVKASKDQFVARATGESDPVKGDIWEIAEDGAAAQIHNACAPKAP